MSYLLRSNLFVPGYGRKYIESALRRNSDTIILDFEDSVPKALKEDAHKTVVEYVSQGRFHDNVTFIRLNELGSQWLEDDLKCEITTDINGFLLPKVTSAKDIQAYEEKIQRLERRMGIEDGWFKFMPMIEGALAVINIHEIAIASKRNIALCFGGEDYLNDIRGVHGKVPKAFDYPRAQIVIAARAAGLQPIDTPFLDFADPKEFIREQTMSYEMGFSGMLIVHPNQIEMANECFMPTRHEIEKARQIIAGIENAEKEGAGIAILNGKMIGPPMEKQARNILELVALQDNMERKVK